MDIQSLFDPSLKSDMHKRKTLLIKNRSIFISDAQWNCIVYESRTKKHSYRHT